MNRILSMTLVATTVAVSAVAQSPRSVPLERMELQNVQAEEVLHRGKRGVRLLEQYGHATPDFRARGEALAILPNSEFRNGTIEVEVAAQPAEGAPENARGFAGIAFRVQAHGERFECFYLRPTNARADDQLRRNHSTQYIAFPDFPWEKLRKEFPGVYESYVDLEPGAWTKVKIVADGPRARLYVGGAAEPCLIVNDLKNEETGGAIALWVGLGTEAWFRNLRITPR